MIGHFADRLQWYFILERISIFERICYVNKSRPLPWTDSFFWKTISEQSVNEYFIDLLNECSIMFYYNVLNELNKLCTSWFVN